MQGIQGSGSSSQSPQPVIGECGGVGGVKGGRGSFRSRSEMCQPTYAQSNITRGLTIPAIFGAFNTHLPGGLQLPQPRGLQYSQPRCFKFPYPRCFQFPHTKHLQSFDLALDSFLMCPRDLTFVVLYTRRLSTRFTLGVFREHAMYKFTYHYIAHYIEQINTKTPTQNKYTQTTSTQNGQTQLILAQKKQLLKLSKNTVYYKYEHRRQTTF